MKAYILFASLVLGFSCTPEKPKTVFDRLVGTWKLADDSQYERWTKNNDGSYSSRMFTLAGQDTNVTEDATITAENQKWIFKTLVKGQNKGKAVTFSSTIMKDTLVQFENPAHDFPRMINYRVVNDTILQAFIAGTTDTIYFNYRRVQ
jgi:hypothetical protein